jgi:glycerophosphoryl diester phosphodiesterase
MKIISHRGFWHTPSEKNTETAFYRSFALDFGTETDVRDCMGELVISHDMPRGEEITLSTLLALMGKDQKLLAINIKSDGLAKLLCKTMSDYNRANWFVFDMSIPDTREHLTVGNPVFTRMSEVEQNPVWIDRVEGVWLDSFDNEWFDLVLISGLLNQGKRVCVVSSELHGREYTSLWTKLLPLATADRLILCTDFPVKAKEFFEGVSSK